MIWDDKAIDLLRERISEGVKASAIGRELGVSKNSIIGKAHRLGLSWGGKPRALGADAAPRRTPKKKSMVRLVVKRVRKPKPRPYRMKALLELTDADCRFIEGNVITGRVFCAKPVLPGGPYCPAHYGLCTGGR